MSEKITCACGEEFYDAKFFVMHYRDCGQAARLQNPGESEKQRAATCDSILNLLDNVSAGWLDRKGTGEQCALRAIKDLADQAARAQGGEAVAEMFTDEYSEERMRWLTGKGFPDGTLFYTRHSASVPERLLYVEDGGRKKDDYVNGWNECIDEMLASRTEVATPRGYTPVRTLVLKWLLGETEAFEPVEGERGKFWWRKRLREAILDTTKPQTADNSHDWDDSGERCLKCGDKDWFAEPDCEGRPNPPAGGEE